MLSYLVFILALLISIIIFKLENQSQAWCCIPAPSSLGGWSRRISWAQEFKASLDSMVRPCLKEADNNNKKMELYCLISQYLGIFLLLVIAFYFNFTVVWQQTLYDFFTTKCIKMCFMASGKHDKCSLWASEECIIFVDRWSHLFIMSNWLIALLGSPLSLPIFCLQDLSIFDRGCPGLQPN
jgi:hypothetical protein